MIAGEFAVLTPNQRIVVMAVNRFVYATIQPSANNQLTLENFQLHNLTWAYTETKVEIHSTRQEKNYVENAMTTAFTYLMEKNIPVEPFHLLVRSELDDASGIKYGLGSSAAVVTSVITVILKMFLPTEPSKSLIFKLAAITHVKTQGNGSGADVAASTYGGVLAYASFQAEWLLEEINTTNTLTELVNKNWVYLSVKSVLLPENAYICIGWTGKPASTRELVDSVLSLKEKNAQAFSQFLQQSSQAVAAFLRGAENSDMPELMDGVKQNRKALATVGMEADTDIETPLLSTLCDLAEQYGGAGKPSGAGGGDSGIAFLPSERQAAELRCVWEKENIKPLNLTVTSFGTISME